MTMAETGFGTEPALQASPALLAQVIDLCTETDHDYTFVRHLQEVADVSLIGCRTLAAANQRHSSLFRASMSGSSMLIERALAADAASDQQLTCIPGLTEDIRHPFDRSFHDQLEAYLPQADVTTIGNNGIGIPNKPDRASRAQTAAQRLELLVHTATNKHVTLLGTSKGAQTSHDIALQNIRAGKPLAIQGLVYFAPAMVENRRTIETMLLRFPFRFGYDMTRAIVAQPFKQRLQSIGALATWGYEAALTLPSLANQLGHLLEGTAIDEIKEVAEHYRILVVNGQRDSVGEQKAWQELAQQSDNIKFVCLPNHGHELPFVPDKPARKLSREIALSGILEA